MSKEEGFWTGVSRGEECANFGTNCLWASKLNVLAPALIDAYQKGNSLKFYATIGLLSDLCNPHLSDKKTHSAGCHNSTYRRWVRGEDSDTEQQDEDPTS